MAQEVRILAALPENLSLIASTQTVLYKRLNLQF